MPLLLYICKFFSDFLCSDMSLLFVTVTLRGVSNKHCLCLFFFIFTAVKNRCILHGRVFLMVGQFYSLFWYKAMQMPDQSVFNAYANVLALSCFSSNRCLCFYYICYVGLY